MRALTLTNKLLFSVNRSRKLVLDSFYYFGSSVIALCLSIITTPVFSKYFSHEDFATFNYFNNFSNFFSFFLSFELMSFYASEFHRNDSEKNKELMSSMTLFLLGWNLVFICVIWWVATYTFSRIGLQLPLHPFLLLALLTVGCGVFRSFWLVQYRLSGASFKYFIVSASSKVFTVLVGLGLVLFLTNTNAAQSRMTGIMIVELIVASCAIVYFLRQGHFRFHPKRIREGLHFCMPVLAGSIIHYLIISSDQIFLERKADVKSLALYSLGLNFASYLYFFNYSVFQALESQIIKYTVTGQFSKLKKASAGLVLTTFSSTIIFTFISKYVIAFLTKGKYTEAYEFANILVFANLFIITYALVNTVLVALKKTRALLYLNGIGGLFGLIVLYLSSQYFGVKAVAYSKISIFIFVSLVGLAIINRKLKAYPHAQ